MNQWPYRIFPQYAAEAICKRCARFRMKDEDGTLFCYNAMCKAFDKPRNDKFLRPKEAQEK